MSFAATRHEEGKMPLFTTTPLTISPLLARFATQVARHASHIAVEADGETWTYAALDAWAERIAVSLQARGVGVESAVGIYIERSAEWIATMLGILKAGGIYVPFDPTYPAERIAYMMAETQVRLVVTVPALAQNLPATEVPVEWVSTLAEAHHPVAPLPSTFGDSLAYIMFTSGSTGKPKGIGIPHKAINRLVVDNAYLDIVPGDRMAHLSNTAFDIATLEVWGPLLNGGTVVCIPRTIALDPVRLAEYFQEARITVADIPTALFNQIVRMVPTAFRGLRYVLFGGEASAPDAVRLVLESGDPVPHLLNAYGPTETTSLSLTYQIPSLAPNATTVPIGTPIDGTTAFVVNQVGELVTEGVTGELWLGGEGLARGYINRPDLTADRFIPDPFSGVVGARLYRTGDMVRRSPTGVIEYMGRTDTQVKIRGYRIELDEIEAALNRHPALRAAAVGVHTVTRDGQSDKQLVGYLVPIDTIPPVAEIRTFLSTFLPVYMVPTRYVTLEALPITPNGKTDRHALPTPDDNEIERDDLVAPTTATEQGLAELWSDLLGQKAISRTDNFIMLGGHSLLLTRLASQIRQRFAVDVPLPDLFRAGTLEELAAKIDGYQNTPDPLALPPLRPRTQQGDAPLTFPQERVWFFNQLVPDTLAYNVQFSMRWHGDLKAEVLETTLQEIIRRHDIFRTTYHDHNGQGVQRVHPVYDFTLPVVDVQDILPEAQEAEVERQIAEAVQVPFDVGHLPLVRWVLYRLAPDDHILLQIEHHFVHDGWSIAVVLREIKELYTAFVQGQPSPLPPLPVQFADFAQWQRDVVQGDRYRALLDYWTRQLADFPPTLDLPTDHPRPKAQALRGGMVRRDMPYTLYEALKATQQREGTTFYMLLQSAFQALLYRYTGQDDLLVGTGVANRRTPESESLIGMIVNTLVLRTRVRGDMSFRELLQQVRQTTLDAYTYQDMPVEKLVEVLQPERDLSRNPLFQVMFSFHDSAIPDLTFPNVTGKITERHNLTAKADMNIVVIPRPEQRMGFEGPIDERVTFLWEYNADLFNRDTMERMVEHYFALLRAVVADAGQSIDALPLLTEAERDDLATWQAGAVMPLESLSVPQRIAHYASTTPDALAVASPIGAWTYRELDERANAIAHALRERGVNRETVVAVLLERTPALIAAWLGVLKAGGAYLPLDLATPDERLALMIGDAGTKVVITDSTLQVRLSQSDVSVLLCDDLNTARRATPPDTVIDPRQSAYIIYTSGSTGTPKGVVIEHHGLNNLMQWHQSAFGITTQDRATHLSGLAFDGGAWDVWSHLTAGASIHQPSDAYRTDPAALHRWVLDQRITIGYFPTPIAEGLLPLEWSTDTALRYLLTGGDRLHTYAPAELPFTLVNNYGPTENSAVSTYGIVPFFGAYPLPSIGGPLPNVQAYVLDATGHPTPIGVPGELYLGGESVGRGYLNRPALTAERFVPDPFSGKAGARLYRTGDIVRWLPTGELEFRGRRDSQVKVRGFRVELGEIEAVLRQQPAISDAAVMVRRDMGASEQVVAYLVSPHPVDAAALRTALQPRLPDYMIPTFFVPMETLPITANGKVNHRALPRPDVAALTTGVPPRDTLETELVGLWQSLLGVESIGVYDNFFHLGGHSLLATQLTARIRHAQGHSVPLRVLFESPTVAGLAAYLRTLAAPTAPAVLTDDDIVAQLSDEEVEAMLKALME